YKKNYTIYKHELKGSQLSSGPEVWTHFVTWRVARHTPLCESWGMETQDSTTTRLDEYITHMLPWAHGHQRKAIRDFVRAIIDQQTGCQAQLARSFGNQEAATKRLSRLLHNERLEPRHLADAVLLQALVQLPAHGPVRLAIDWTIEGDQHLLVVSLIVGRRAVPIYGRAYAVTVLKGRMQRYELAVIRRALRRV